MDTTGGMDAITSVPTPRNEPVRDYAPGSAERDSISAALRDMSASNLSLTMSVGGERRMAGGDPIEVRAPHRRDLCLGTMTNATSADARSAVDAALGAAPAWR